MPWTINDFNKTEQLIKICCPKMSIPQKVELVGAFKNKYPDGIYNKEGLEDGTLTIFLATEADRIIKDMPIKIDNRGGKRSKQKGSRGERELVKEINERIKGSGLVARRQPVSGGIGEALGIEALSGDVIIIDEKTEQIKVKIQSKFKKEGYTQLYNDIQGHDVLAIKQNQEDYLCIIRVADFAGLLYELGIN